MHEKHEFQIAAHAMRSAECRPSLETGGEPSDACRRFERFGKEDKSRYFGMRCADQSQRGDEGGQSSGKDEIQKNTDYSCDIDLTTRMRCGILAT